METPENQSGNLDHQTRTYFLGQGQSISRLHELLNSNLLLHHLSKGLSVVLEIVLYLTFVILIFLVICLPTDLTAYAEVLLREAGANNFGQDAFAIRVYNPNFSLIIYTVKLLIVLFVALPLLLFARLLARNRKKSRLIRTAFGEVEKMKKNFEEALKILRL